MTPISFSIVMANYNNDKYIQEAIQSVISQTYSNWELIIVDDASTDTSIEKIKPFLVDKRIKLIRLKQNKGVGYAKRMGCKNAVNDILGILDSDDKLVDNALEIVVKCYEQNTDIGFIYTNMWSCDSELKNCVISRNNREVPEKKSIFNPIILHFHTFKRKDYLKTLGYDPNLKSSVDKDIIYKLEEITSFKFINKPLYYYRHHKKGISQNKNKTNARINHYKAKCKTYRRRLNTDLPNFKLNELYYEYCKITFNNIVNLLKSLFKIFKLSKLERIISKYLKKVLSR